MKSKSTQALALFLGAVGASVLVAACSGSNTSLSNIGGACNVVGDCVSGLNCTKAPGALVGTCTKTSCTTQAECGGASFCAGDKSTGGGQCIAYTGPSSSPTGQTDAPCDAAKGLDNEDCDGAHGFKCLGASPSDGAAVCALYDCKADSDCGPGHFCGDINTTPSAATTTRRPGETVKVCQVRGYCGACATDVDCAKRGTEAGRCVLDEKGGSYCTYSCTSDKECPLDANCIKYQDGSSQCMPNAGVCKGDGALCSPCAADSDCKNGECLRADYSTERYCSEKVAVCGQGACKAESVTTKARPASASVSVGCTDKPNAGIPTNQCVGLVQLGTDNSSQPLLMPACWTRKRR